ncbi:MAG: phosphatase PAP2 family protein [Bifidobacterium sp.]|uniref:phosphatase PAP2 family protein n=1 Tax=Bifidobacterium sp. TaxID=41200 RepID=UPI003F02EA12
MLTVILVIVPFVVALSRVIYGVHYPTDVCTSLVLTPVLVWCVYRLCDPAR